MIINLKSIIEECKKPDAPTVTKAEINKQLLETIEHLKEQKIYPANKEIAASLALFMAETKLNARTKGLFLIGSCGTGKTVASKIIAGYRKYEFYTAKNLHREYFKYEDKDGLYDKIKNNTPIVIDDIGAETTINSYGNKFELMSEFIQDRHELFVRWETLTIMTTNLNGDEFKARYGERVFSRICQMCECVVTNGTDLRLNNQ